jgi:hypothetical protein
MVNPMCAMSRILCALALGLTTAIAACSDAVTRPPDGGINTPPDTNAAPGDTTPPPPASPQLIQCPTTQTASSSGLVSILGGTITAAGSAISLPAGSLLAVTLIKVTVPASTYMEVDITANDLVSFAFERPVTVTIDYSRCPTSVTAGKTLTVWHIDPQTKQLLTNMGGVNDASLRRITFTTDHLSGYAIAQ